MSTPAERRIYREGLITAAEIAEERGALLVAKAIRAYAAACGRPATPTPPTQERPTDER